MAEYVMGPDENQEEVSRALLEHAGPDRASEVAWYPRPGVPGGGVFSMPDDLAEGFTSSHVSRLDDGSTGDAGATQATASSRSRRQAAKAKSDTDNKE
jgi:hypothetical protein